MTGLLYDKSGAKPSYWLKRAACNLDLALQCCGSEESTEIDQMESRCDELAKKLEEQGR